MALPEYSNLTAEELEYADHCAEVGDMSGLRRFQEISAARAGTDCTNTVEYHNPMIPRKIEDD